MLSGGGGAFREAGGMETMEGKQLSDKVSENFNSISLWNQFCWRFKRHFLWDLDVILVT